MYHDKFQIDKYFVNTYLITAIILIMNSSVLLASYHKASVILPISTASFPPFKFRDKDTGKIIGFDTEIITAVFKSMNITLKIRMLPFIRADKKTREGNYAAYYTFTKNVDREKDYYFSNPISSVQDLLFFKKSKNISWSNYSDLSEYKLGYSEKYNYDKKFLNAIKNKFPVLSENNEEHLLNLLVNNRFDMMICEASVCSYLIKKNPKKFKDVVFFNKPIGIPEPRAFYIGFSKKWPASQKLRDDFNVALKNYVSKSSKPRKTIFEKYGAPCPKKLFTECK